MVVAKGGELAVEQLEKELGLQVRGLRKSRGLTQQQLAAQANMSLGAVKNLEAGHGATTRTLTRVLRALEAEDWIGTLYAPQTTFNPLHLPGVKGRSTPQGTAKDGFRGASRYERAVKGGP